MQHADARTSRPQQAQRLLSRREALAGSLAAGGIALGAFPYAYGTSPNPSSSQRKKVCAVVTIYRRNSHADVLVGKILEGWEQNSGPGPQLELVSMYVDQFPADDLSRDLAEKHGFRLCKSIQECIELDTNSVAVDGILSIGEHGDYPHNEIGQHLYPRRRFFSEICDVLERRKKIVPVFNDKHPGPVWQDAQWMMQRAQQLNLPWMAGTSLTVGYRDPDVTLPLNEPLDSAMAVGYSGLDIYGFHTLDFLQSMVERRATEKQGVRSVQAWPLSEVDRLLELKTFDRELFKLLLQSSGTNLEKLREAIPTALANDTAIFLINYEDGLQGYVFMLGSFANGISAGCRSAAGRTIVTRAEERTEPRYPHFAYLLRAIEKMIHSGKPSYAVERTILAAGVLDRSLNSLNKGFKELQTPELNLNYRCIDYPHAPHVALN
jgi:hypothetical protein